MVKILLSNGMIWRKVNSDLTSNIEKHKVKQVRKSDFHLKIMSPLMLKESSITGPWKKR